MKNPSGKLRSVLRWASPNQRKRDDQQHNTNNLARTQVIAEWKCDLDDMAFDYIGNMKSPAEEVGEEAAYTGDFGPGVLFNGEPAEAWAPLDTPWDPYCWCTECVQGRTIDALRGDIAALEAEVHLVRHENTILNARVNFLEVRHGYK